jgi:hypothetical protein
MAKKRPVFEEDASSGEGLSTVQWVVVGTILLLFVIGLVYFVTQGANPYIYHMF